MHICDFILCWSRFHPLHEPHNYGPQNHRLIFRNLNNPIIPKSPTKLMQNWCDQMPHQLMVKKAPPSLNREEDNLWVASEQSSRNEKQLSHLHIHEGFSCNLPWKLQLFRIWYKQIWSLSSWLVVVEDTEPELSLLSTNKHHKDASATGFNSNSKYLLTNY